MFLDYLDKSVYQSTYLYNVDIEFSMMGLMDHVRNLVNKLAIHMNYKQILMDLGYIEVKLYNRKKRLV
jgi:hypothetical protein